MILTIFTSVAAAFFPKKREPHQPSASSDGKEMKRVEGCVCENKRTPAAHRRSTISKKQRHTQTHTTIKQN